MNTRKTMSPREHVNALEKVCKKKSKTNKELNKKFIQKNLGNSVIFLLANNINKYMSIISLGKCFYYPPTYLKDLEIRTNPLIINRMNLKIKKTRMYLSSKNEQ